MSKFHANEDGVVSKCSAKPGNCPFGSDLEHFNTPEKTRKFYELKNQEKVLPATMKTNKKINVSKPLVDMLDENELKTLLQNKRLNEAIEEYNKLQEQFKTLDANENKTFDNYNEMVKISDQRGVVKQEIEELKNVNAALVSKVFPEPTEHELQVPDSFQKIATYDSGTKEWLEARQNSLGGSDVGAFTFADETYGLNNYYSVTKSKKATEVEDQIHTGATMRGDLWEPALIDLASKELGEPVYVNKSTFKEMNEDGTEGYRHVNLDGFTTNPDGSIKAIVECKTSSKPEAWENGKIPAGYVLQCQHYMDCLNVNEAYIAVNINDTDFKMIEITPETKVQKSSIAIKRGVDIPEKYSYQDAKDLAIDQIKELNNQRAEILKGNVTAPKARKFNWKKTWGNVIKENKKLAFIDLETSTFSEKTGHVIEIAAFKEDDNGNLIKFHKFYGVPEAHEKWNGTGASDVHHITPEDVRGLKPFREDKQAQAELREFLTDKDGSLLTGVAHNAQYEKKHFIGSLGINDMEWVDTVHAYGGVGNENRPNNKLESLVEESGASYEDAHHADADTLMMYNAYKNYLLPKMKKLLSE